MMHDMIAFFSDYTFQVVALGSGILGLISGVLGSFAVLRKQSLLGDAVSHAALPGIALAFLLTGSKNTEVLLLGAFLSGIIGTLLIMYVVKYSRIKFDSALALVMSVFFGFGLVLLTFMQKIPNANQAGLNRFLFGQASTLLKSDVVFMSVAGVCLLLLVALFWKEFKIFVFDSDYAHSIGFSTRKLDLLLSFMIVGAIIIGLQTVGVILMSAMLIAPGVAARQWTNRLSVMIFLAAFFGAFSGIAGTTVSSLLGKMPTGPAIVVIISLIVIASLLFAPGRGMIWSYLRRKRNQRAILRRKEIEHVTTT